LLLLLVLALGAVWLANMCFRLCTEGSCPEGCLQTKLRLESYQQDDSIKTLLVAW